MSFIDSDFVLSGDEEIKEDDGEEEENMGKTFNAFFRDFILNSKKQKVYWEGKIMSKIY